MIAIPAEINSNDVGLLEFLSKIRIRILSSWELFPKNISNFCVFGVRDTQSEYTCACAVACFHTCVDQTDTHKQHTQHTLPFQLWLGPC